MARLALALFLAVLGLTARAKGSIESVKELVDDAKSAIIHKKPFGGLHDKDRDLDGDLLHLMGCYKSCNAVCNSNLNQDISINNFNPCVQNQSQAAVPTQIMTASGRANADPNNTMVMPIVPTAMPTMIPTMTPHPDAGINNGAFDTPVSEPYDKAADSGLQAADEPQDGNVFSTSLCQASASNVCGRLCTGENKQAHESFCSHVCADRR